MEAHTWDEAVAKWQRERYWRDPETVRRENALLRWAHSRLAGRQLEDITRRDLEALRDDKRAEGASPRTANYVCQAVSAILRAAVRWEWLSRAPSVDRVPEGPQREVFLSAGEAARLLGALPLHLRLLAAFSLETGLRQGNARLLEWRHVQRDKNRLYLPGRQVKNRKPLPVPLTRAARRILDECKGQHPQFVFTYNGEPMLQPRNSAWYRVLSKLGLKGLHWHDMRHTWASWHMEAGTDSLVLQKLGGWKTASMVSRYAHMNDRAAQRAVKNFDRKRV